MTRPRFPRIVLHRGKLTRKVLVIYNGVLVIGRWNADDTVSPSVILTPANLRRVVGEARKKGWKV